MPLFTLTVHCESAAFGEADTELPLAHSAQLRWELARILRKTAKDVLRHKDAGSSKYQNIHDLNGNPVGTWRLLTEE